MAHSSFFKMGQWRLPKKRLLFMKKNLSSYEFQKEKKMQQTFVKKQCNSYCNRMTVATMDGKKCTGCAMSYDGSDEHVVACISCPCGMVPVTSRYCPSCLVEQDGETIPPNLVPQARDGPNPEEEVPVTRDEGQYEGF